MRSKTVAEMIDIYDEDMNFTGVTVPRKGAFMEEGQFMLYALAIVEDMHGNILITKRADNKKWAAGQWEVQGGGVACGETPLMGAIREVGEEVGLVVTKEQAQFCYCYTNIDLERGDNYINSIYRFKLDFALDDVRLQEREATDVRLATWDEIGELEEQGLFLHYARIKKALEM